MNVRGHDELTPLLFGGARELVNLKLCPANGAVDHFVLRAEVATAIDQSLTITGHAGFDESHLPHTNVAEWMSTI